MTMEGFFHCNKCEITFKGTYKPQQRPRKACPTCHKMTDLQRSKLSTHDNIPPHSTIDETFLGMNKVEMIEHLYMMAICDKKLPMRERLDAGSKLQSLLNNQDRLKEESISDKEMMDKFKQQDLSTLVSRLKEERELLQKQL